MRSSDLSSIFAILRKRLWMILLLFAVTMTVILIGALNTAAVYQSAVRLQVIPVERAQVALYGPARSEASDVELISFQFSQVIKTSRIAWRTINRTGVKMTADELLKGLNVIQDYGFVTVIASAHSPADAEAIVTWQVENALAAYREEQARPAVATGEFIAERLGSAEQTLATTRNDLLRFKLTHNLESLEREITAYQDIVRGLRRSKDDAALQEAQFAARIAALEGEAAKADLAATQAKANSDAEALAVRRAADLRLAVSNLHADLAAQRALQAGYERAIAQAETDLTSLIGLSEEAARLANAVAQAKNTRDFLLDKSLEAQLKQQQSLSVGHLKVIEPARRPDQPLPGRALQIAIIGGVLSLALGVMLAFLFEFFESLTRQARPPA